MAEEKEEKAPIPEEKIEDIKSKIEKSGEIKSEESKFRINVKPERPKLPEITDKTKLDVKYALIEPYAYAHIHWDEVLQEIIYEVEEPELDNKEKEILKTIEEGIEELINISFLGIKTPEAVIAFLEKNIRVLLNELGIKIGEESFLKLMYYVYRDFVGLNEIEPLMQDYFIEDIECNGVQSPIYIVHRNYRNLKTNIIYNKIEHLTSFVEKLAQKSGKYISYASPILDAALPDGSRVNCVYSQEIASRGPSFTIRKFFSEPWSPIKMIEVKTASPEILAYLWLLVEHEANIIVIGGTGSGKTSFINCLAFFIKPESRIVTIEDTKELQLMHENWLPSVARVGMSGGKGEITLFDLLKASFRQRPDYIIVGEIRGAEAFVLFQGMASIEGNEKILVLNDNHFKRIPIKELEGKDLKKIKAVTVDPDTNEIKALLIKGFFKHPPRKVLYEIITENGKKVLTTPDHSVFTYTDKLIPKEVKELKKGDIIASVDVDENKIDNSKLKGEKITKITKIKLKNPKYVYDISIPGFRNFVGASGILLHNSGHPSMGTMHADDVETMIRRLETQPINLSPTLVESMDAVVVMTQAKYKAKPVRRVAKVVEIVKIFEERGKSKTNTPFIWDPRNDKFFYKLESYVFDKLISKHGLVKENLIKEFSNRSKLLFELYKRKIIGFEEVQKIIHDYYRDSEEVLKRFGIK